MNFLIHFFLAHFLSDYPFQSGKLVKLKQKRFLGVFLHTGIHLITMLVLLFPLLYIREVQYGIAFIYVTHNIIDQIKVSLDKANPKNARFLYFLDQFVHWTIIYFTVRYIGEVNPELSGQALALYTNNTLFLYILLMVISTYFYDVSRYFVMLKMNKPFKRDYKTMILNGFIVTIAFGIYWLAY